jgi:archaellum component FlaF (FlaF/FlaG flagellin family)
MGFSVTIAAFIVLIGFIAIFSTFCTVLFTSITDISNVANQYVISQIDKLNTQIRLTVDTISPTSSEITLKNIGSNTIFLQKTSGYSWNTIILAYTGNDETHSYAIENYVIEEIRVTGTNAVFNPEIHNYINPGEEARISINLPPEAPGISSQDVVSVTFASYYGTTASSEGVLA